VSETVGADQLNWTGAAGKVAGVKSSLPLAIAPLGTAADAMPRGVSRAASSAVLRAVPSAAIIALLCAALHGNARAQAAPGGAPAVPTKLSLQCTGWMPMYGNWLQPQPPPGSGQNVQLAIQIDRAARSIASSLEMVGAITAPLQVSDRYYSGIVPMGRMVANRTLDAVEISVNRVTGEGRLRYQVGESAYTAFDGKCAVAPE